MPNALLIDDEDLAREEMHRLLAAHPEITVVGEADNIVAARQLLAKPGYDLVFLDIDLGGGSGFDLVPNVAAEARIIFVTAHNDFAVRAFEVNALDYLLKPVSSTRLAASLARIVLAAATKAATPAAVVDPVSAPATSEPEDGERALGSLTHGDRVFLKNDRGARFVALSDLAAVISCDNYSEVFVADGSHFLVRRSLKTWETALPGDQFVRVHRQALVNLTQIERVEEPSGDTPSLWLRGLKQAVACSHRLSPELRRRLVK